MRLPFSHGQFLGVFAAYNSTWWPVELALWILTLVALGSLAAGRAHSRALFLLLAAHWASGAVYHLLYFSQVNPTARVFGALFLLQALLLLWLGVARRGPTFAWGGEPRQVLSVVFAVLGMAYPALSLASGFRWPAMPVFAVPCPTTLITISLLLALEPKRWRGLAVVPLAWTIVGGSAAVVLGMAQDLSLLVGGAALFLYVVAPGLWAIMARGRRKG